MSGRGFDRFDVPEIVKVILNKSVEIEMLDASDIVTLGATHGNDWKSLIDDILEIAYSNIHWNTDHSKIAPLVNEYYRREVL